MRLIACLPLLVTIASACDSPTRVDNNDGNNPFGLPTSGPGLLTVSPLDTSTHYASSPLGSLSPPGHVLPTDHVYIYFVNPWNGQQQLNDCSKRPVRAAGSGVVTFVLQTETTGDTKVDIQMTKTFHYYYDHVLLLPGIAVGSRVQAGDTIATTTGRCPGIDLGVIDLDVSPPGFLNPARYGASGMHVASPYKYFAEPLRTWLYAHVQLHEGIPANKDGKLDWGVRGHLVGDWFHSSLAPNEASTNPTGWPKTLAFVYDWFDATQVRISVGGTIAEPGVVRIGAGEPDPANVSVADGLVVYTTTTTLGRIPSGWLLVQMIATDRIRAEYVAGTSSKPAAFSGAAQEYLR